MLVQQRKRIVFLCFATNVENLNKQIDQKQSVLDLCEFFCSWIYVFVCIALTEMHFIFFKIL